MQQVAHLKEKVTKREAPHFPCKLADLWLVSNHQSGHTGPLFFSVHACAELPVVQKHWGLPCPHALLPSTSWPACTYIYIHTNIYIEHVKTLSLTIFVSRGAMVQCTGPWPPLLPDFCPGFFGWALNGSFIAFLTEKEEVKRGKKTWGETLGHYQQHQMRIQTLEKD